MKKISILLTSRGASQKVLDLCDNRVVLFDNETMDVSKRSEQRNKLLSLVELVVKKNGGQPFLDKSLAEVSVWQHLSFCTSSVVIGYTLLQYFSQ